MEAWRKRSLKLIVFAAAIVVCAIGLIAWLLPGSSVADASQASAGNDNAIVVAGGQQDAASDEGCCG